MQPTKQEFNETLLKITDMLDQTFPDDTDLRLIQVAMVFLLIEISKDIGFTQEHFVDSINKTWHLTDHSDNLH
jgi:hypothetical protein